MSPDQISKMDQANAEADAGLNITLNEIKAQLAEGHSEENVTLGLYDYLTNYSKFSRAELIIMLMRAVIRLAKSGESK